MFAGWYLYGTALALMFAERDLEDAALAQHLITANGTSVDDLL